MAARFAYPNTWLPVYSAVACDAHPTSKESYDHASSAQADHLGRYSAGARRRHPRDLSASGGDRGSRDAADVAARHVHQPARPGPRRRQGPPSSAPIRTSSARRIRRTPPGTSTARATSSTRPCATRTARWSSPASRRYRSTDLVHWSFVGEALPTRPAWIGDGDMWAPDVAYVGGRYLLYYTATNTVDSGRRLGDRRRDERQPGRAVGRLRRTGGRADADAREHRPERPALGLRPRAADRRRPELPVLRELLRRAVRAPRQRRRPALRPGEPGAGRHPEPLRGHPRHPARRLVLPARLGHELLQRAADRLRRLRRPLDVARPGRSSTAPARRCSTRASAARRCCTRTGTAGSARATSPARSMRPARSGCCTTRSTAPTRTSPVPAPTRSGRC